MATKKQRLPLDFWHFATQSETALRAGVSGPDDIARFLGLRSNAIRMRGRDSDGWPGAQIDDLYFQFDPEHRLQGINYGFHIADTLPRTIEWMITHPDDDPESPAGTPSMAVNGKPIPSLATLPLFIASLAGMPAVDLKSRDSDKWLRLTIEHDAGTFCAEFLLKAVKISLSSRFTVDYCLYGISVMSKTALRNEASLTAPSV